MKYIVIALTGAADEIGSNLYSKTPLEVAKMPFLNGFAKSGRVGTVQLAVPGLNAYPETAILGLLGQKAKKDYAGRGPLEAANLDLELEENEIPFCMNFITESSGNLMDPSAGSITTRESKALINYLNKKVASDFVRFFPGSESRHIAVLKDSQGYDALSAKTVAPDTIVNKKLETFFPKGPGEELLRKLMYDARLLLQDHEINQVRVDLQENPANMIWLWGQGKMPAFKNFSDSFGVSAALISHQEYVRGMARLAGLTVVDTPELKKDYQEDLGYVSQALFESLQDKDCVVCHLNFCDSASYAGDFKGKVSALEACDFFLLSKVREYLDNHDDVRVLVTPVYKYSCEKQKRLSEAVPYVMTGKGIAADEIEKFTELAAESSELKSKAGTELLTSLFAQN